MMQATKMSETIEVKSEELKKIPAVKLTPHLKGSKPPANALCLGKGKGHIDGREEGKQFWSVVWSEDGQTSGYAWFDEANEEYYRYDEEGEQTTNFSWVVLDGESHVVHSSQRPSNALMVPGTSCYFIVAMTDDGKIPGYFDGHQAHYSLYGKTHKDTLDFDWVVACARSSMNSKGPLHDLECCGKLIPEARPLSREYEKYALHTLNNRLSGYVDRVGVLLSTHGSVKQEVDKHAHYKQIIKDLYDKQIAEIRARVQELEGLLLEERKKFEGEQGLSVKLKIESELLKAEEGVLQEKIELLKKELVEAQINREFEIKSLRGALRDLQKRYEAEMENVRAELTLHYEKKIKVEIKTKFDGADDKLIDAQTKIKVLEKEVVGLKQANEKLTQEGAIYKAQIKAKDIEIQVLKDKLEEQAAKYKTLKEIKNELDMEIAVYRRLVHYGEDRLGNYGHQDHNSCTWKSEVRKVEDGYGSTKGWVGSVNKAMAVVRISGAGINEKVAKYESKTF